MMAASRVSSSLAVLLVLLVAPALAQAPAGTARTTAVDKAFEDFWKADDPKDAARAAERVLKTGVDFDTAWARLKAGRAYKQEKTGELTWRHSAGMGAVFENRIEIPQDYDPARPWAMRVQLHGGVNRPATQMAGLEIEQESGSESSGGGGGRAPSLSRRTAANRIPGDNQIYVYPSGWVDAQWWHGVQIDNILRVIDTLKRRSNVDESHVYLTGISDGGTGAYFIAMKETTIWSSFLPLNGSILVLGNPDIRADGEAFANNLVNKPLYIVNGGLDRLYPVANVQTHIDWFKTLGVPLVFNPQPSAGHDTSWWPHVRGPFEHFVKERSRQPQPHTLSWETERTDRYNRAHWLVIDALGPTGSDQPAAEPRYFTHRGPSGRVDIVRRGNAFEARTRGVRAFRVLLSPDVIDFAHPVILTVNGKPAFEGPVTKDPAVLLTWAAKDNDRTMLYGAELRITVQ